MVLLVVTAMVVLVVDDLLAVLQRALVVSFPR